MRVIKRDGTRVKFDKTHISDNIMKANSEIEDRYKILPSMAIAIAEEIEKELEEAYTKRNIVPNVERIQDLVVVKLASHGYYQTMICYQNYRFNRGLVRERNTTDESIMGLVRCTNKEAMDENSNKNAYIASTQRDLIAGEVSRDLTYRVLLPKKIADAHKLGILHFHDADYFLESIFNCCLINIKDMLDNGTVMNGKLIETPKSFQVACNVTTQIIAAVASSQYGKINCRFQFNPSQGCLV